MMGGADYEPSQYAVSSRLLLPSVYIFENFFLWASGFKGLKMSAERTICVATRIATDH
jgi:hypothetical protein